MQVAPLPYLSRENKLEQLSELLKCPWSMLLDSAGSDLNYNRFDILVAEPEVKLAFTNGELELTGSPHLDLSKHNSQPPLKAMRDILATLDFNEITSQSDLPFNGGWLGYISYDFGRYLEKLPDQTSDEINLPWLNFGLYRWALITDHKRRETNLYNFGVSNSEWLNIQQKVTQAISAKNLNSAQCDSEQHNPAQSDSEQYRNKANNNQPFKIDSEWKSNTSQQEYAEAFAKIKDYIYAGDCYQVNYAQQFSARYSGNEFDAYRKLSVANKAPFSAYMNFEDHKILSLSPERFIEAHDQHVITQPIKGTRPRSEDPTEDKKLGEELVNSEKDRAENLMIVDLLRNDLSRTAAKGSVKVSELFGHYRFQSVHHLISTIESELNQNYDNFDLLATTLPGGSITGAPKIRAMEIIEELEKVKRNLYCGVIGYIDAKGNMDTNICIRTLVAKDNQLFCWAGGGLVADSEMEQEYQETFDKLRKILPILSPEYSPQVKPKTSTSN